MRTRILFYQRVKFDLMEINKHTAITYPWSIKAPIAVFSCLITLLLSYIYDEIISIHETLSKHFMARAMMSSKEFESYYDLMIASQSFTSIFGSLCLGYIADNWGYRVVMMLISFLISTAQIIIELGLIELNLKIFILGRVLLNISYGSLGLPIGRIIKKYFGPDNNFGMFNSLVQAFSILGFLLNSVLASNFYYILGPLKASIIPLLIAFITSLCLIILALIDQRYQNQSEHEQINLNRNISYYGSKIYPQRYLVISMIIQNALIGIFCIIASKFINQFWGSKDSYFSHQTNDDYLTGIFWLVTLLIVIPTGTYVSKYSIDCITILAGATLLQLTGFTFILFVNPFISMQLVAAGLAVRWAVQNPIMIGKFQQDFGVVFGLIGSVSAFLQFSMSLISESIFNHQGSYYDSFLMFLGLQIMATFLIIKYKRWQISTIETESEAFTI